MQGTVPQQCTLTGYNRIIPAHAGNRMLELKRVVKGEDHPCACREQPTSAAVVGTVIGSSLRMQGTATTAAAAAMTGGIIPAHAGNSTPAPSRKADHRDHPCACREQYVQCVKFI